MAAALRRSDFSMSFFTKSRQSELLLSSNNFHVDFIGGNSTISDVAGSAMPLPQVGILSSRRRTTLDAASTSSMTKITS